MSAAHKSAPIGRLGLKTHWGRPIRTKRFYGLYGHVGRRRCGNEEGITRASSIGPAVGSETSPSPQLGGVGGRIFRVVGAHLLLLATLPRIGVKHAVV
jgi:hypothetical protein